MTKKEFCIMSINPNYSITRTPIYCHRHEIFYGKNRQKSIEYGLIVFLRPEDHNMSNEGVHFNKTFDLYLKRLGQLTWMAYYNKTVDNFIKVFGKNYLY